MLRSLVRIDLNSSPARRADETVDEFESRISAGLLPLAVGRPLQKRRSWLWCSWPKKKLLTRRVAALSAN
jgi:hypothetical protein